MVRGSKPLASIIALAVQALLASVARAEDTASVACLYGMLNESRAIVRWCKEPLDAEHEKQYVILNRMFEDFIQANAPPERAAKIIELWGAEGSRKHTKDRGQESCASHDYRDIKQMAESFTTPEGVAKFSETLKAPRDPMKGDCL